MNRQPQWYWKRRWPAWLAGAIILAAGTVPNVDAQMLPAPVSASPGPFSPAARSTQGIEEGKETLQPPKEIVPPPKEVVAGVDMGGGCSTCGGGGHCVPGQFTGCFGCTGDTFAGRILCGFYEELCCPDPCYDPKWIPAANAAFFVEGTRPVTATRIRWEYGNDFTFPDRSEYFWAKEATGKGPPKAETSLNYSQLSLYQEVAAKGFSAFIDMPYLMVDPQVNAAAAGFGDMKIGTKSLLFDRDLFQIGFMFTTYLPVGRFSSGLGTGHVSLEPSLLTTVKITPDTYFQTQLAEWIPLGTDTDDQGSIFHFHLSLNHVLCRPVHNVELIGTAELSGYSFQAGTFTDPILLDPMTGKALANPAHPETYVTAGPGIRLVICEWLDMGFGTAFALGAHGPDQTYRTELRIRY